MDDVTCPGKREEIIRPQLRCLRFVCLCRTIMQVDGTPPDTAENSSAPVSTMRVSHPSFPGKSCCSSMFGLRVNASTRMSCQPSESVLTTGEITMAAIGSDLRRLSSPTTSMLVIQQRVKVSGGRHSRTPFNRYAALRAWIHIPGMSSPACDGGLILANREDATNPLVSYVVSPIVQEYLFARLQILSPPKSLLIPDDIIRGAYGGRGRSCRCPRNCRNPGRCSGSGSPRNRVGHWPYGRHGRSSRQISRIHKHCRSPGRK